MERSRTQIGSHIQLATHKINRHLAPHANSVGKLMNLRENFALLCTKNCTNVRKKGHFATVNRSGKKPLHTLGDEQSVSEEECYDVSEDEAHAVLKTVKKSDQILITCLVNNQP